MSIGISFQDGASWRLARAGYSAAGVLVLMRDAFGMAPVQSRGFVAGYPCDRLDGTTGFTAGNPLEAHEIPKQATSITRSA